MTAKRTAGAPSWTFFAAAALLLAGASACDSDTATSPDAGAADLQIQDAGVERPVADQGATGTLTITVLSQQGTAWESQWLADTASTTPLAGATVAADLPGDQRRELTTGADGTVTFEGVAWSAGTAAVTAHADGHVVRSMVGLSEADGAQTLYLLQYKDPPETIQVTGTATNLDPENDWLELAATTWGDYYSGTGPDFSLTVEKGKPFSVYGLQMKFGEPTTQEMDWTFFGWTKADHAGATGPVSLDLDFSQTLTPVTVSGSMVLPTDPTSVVGTGSCPKCWVLQRQTQLFLGGCYKTTQQSGSTFAYEAEYIQQAGASGILTRYQADLNSSPQNWSGSCVYTEGYPAAGGQVTGFLEVPSLVQPAPNLPAPYPREKPIQWKNAEPEAVVTILLLHLDPPIIKGGEMVAWIVEGRPGTTTLTLPQLPSTATEAAVFGQGDVVKARVRLCGELDRETGWCPRYADSPPFQIELF